MNNTNFVSKMLKGRDVSAAPLMNNYNKSANIKKEQIGRSMIEMLGVLAIIGVLSVGGIAGYSKAMMKYRINKTIEQVTLITGNIRSFFKDKYPNLTCFGVEQMEDGCKVIRKAKLVPDEMITFNSDGELEAISNTFGGDVFLVGDEGFFSIVFYNIPPEACIELATYDWRPTGINVVGTYSEKSNDMGAYTPVDLDKAMQLCQNDTEELWFSYNNPGPSYWGTFFE